MPGRTTTPRGTGRSGAPTRVTPAEGRVEWPTVTRARAPRRRPARPTGGRRRPPQRTGPDLIDRGIDGVGRGLLGLGRGVGRAVKRTGDIDPAHRRDGLGVVLLVLAVISAAGIWFGAGGPVGRWLTTGIGFVVGRGAVVLPVLLAVAGVLLMVRTARPDVRPRMSQSDSGFLRKTTVLPSDVPDG